MIKNLKQYQVTKEQAGKFKETLIQLEKKKSKMDIDLYSIQSSALQSQYNELLKEMEIYDSLKSKQLKVLSIESLDEIYKVLIQARIALGWTQKELAEKLDLKEQQIQRYEATDYQTASWLRILEICDVLDIKIRFEKIILSKPNFTLPCSLNEEAISENQKRLSIRKSFFQIC